MGHAKYRSPSSAARWVPCPASVTVAPLYPNDSNEHSLKGDKAHAYLQDGITFGIKPDTDDPDMDENIYMVLDWIADRRAEYGPDCKVYAEQTYLIPETGEIGTCDITFVWPGGIHIADYKNGYVMTDATEQMLCYLLGAIGHYGERQTYRTTVIQPNYMHRDGPIRTTYIDEHEVELFRLKIDVSINEAYLGIFNAGAWCKKTYCPHRGGCATFKAWCETNARDAWYPHEVNAITDEELAQALDHSDTLHGVRDSYRKEAMRRIAQHDRAIHGYKLVKSRQDRDFAGDEGRATCYAKLIEIGYNEANLVEVKVIKAGGITIQETKALTVPGVERLVKQKYKHFKRGTWKEVWDREFRPHIREFSGSLTLERVTDGRPAHTRGSEFGSLVPPRSVQQVI